MVDGKVSEIKRRTPRVSFLSRFRHFYHESWSDLLVPSSLSDTPHSKVRITLFSLRKKQTKVRMWRAEAIGGRERSEEEPTEKLITFSFVFARHFCIVPSPANCQKTDERKLLRECQQMSRLLLLPSKGMNVKVLLWAISPNSKKRR